MFEAKKWPRNFAWFAKHLLFTKVERACRCFNIKLSISLLTSYVYKMIEGRGLWTPHVYVLYLYSRISWTESKIGCCYYISDWLLCCSSQREYRLYEVTLSFSTCILFFWYFVITILLLIHKYLFWYEIARMKSRVFKRGNDNPWEDRESQFVYVCSLLSNAQFIRKQNCSKWQILSWIGQFDKNILHFCFRTTFLVTSFMLLS